MVAVANNSLLAQPVRVYRLYTQIDNDVRRMQICIAEQLVIEDYDIRAGNQSVSSFEINVWPARFALFEAVGGEMVRVPQEQENDSFPTRLEIETPSYFTWD